MSIQLGQSYAPPLGSGSQIVIPNETAPQNQLQLDQKQQIVQQGTFVGDTYKLLVSSLDATPGFLDSKIGSMFSIVGNKLTLTGFGSLTTTNLTEGSNLYYTQDRFDLSLNTKTSDDLAEGVLNRYFTSELFDSSFSDKTTDDLPEGLSNKYLDVITSEKIDELYIAMHTHSNKVLLDEYTFSNNNILDLISKSHEHSNIDVLDATTASFTIELMNRYDSYTSQAISSAVDPLILENGILMHSVVDGNKHVPSNSGTSSYDVLISTGYDGEYVWENLSSILSNSGILETVPTYDGSKITASSFIYLHRNNSYNEKHLTESQLSYLTSDVVNHIDDLMLHVPAYTLDDIGKFLTVGFSDNLVWSTSSVNLTTSGNGYISTSGTNIDVGSPTLRQIVINQGNNISIDFDTNTISAIFNISNNPESGNGTTAISSGWAYSHSIMSGVNGHIPQTSTSGQFLAWDGTFKDIAQYAGNSDTLDFALAMQIDSTLNPGVSPTIGDRYIILDPLNLNANFGAISGIGANDIVEYSGTEFVVSFDSSASTASVSVTVTLDMNGNSDREWYYSVSGSEWRDRGVSGTQYWASTGGNLSPLSTSDNLLFSLNQKLSWDIGNSYIVGTNTNEIKVFTNSTERILVNTDNLVSLLPIKVDSIIENTLNNGVTIDGVLLKDNAITATQFNVLSDATRIAADVDGNMVFTDAISGSKKLSELIGGGSGSSSFIGLTDVNETTFVGNAGFSVLVNSGETAVEFIDLFSLKTTDNLTQGTTNLYNKVPTGGASGQYLVKNSNANFDTSWGNVIMELLNDTTPQLGGFLDTNSKAIQESQGADIASATNLAPLQDGNFFNVTGTTTINDIITTSVWRTGSEITLRFTGVCLLTHNGTVTGNNKPMWLDKGANYTTAANDILVLRLDGTYWREVNRLTKVVSSSGGDITLNRTNPTVVANALAFDWASKNNLISNKSGGGGIDIGVSTVTVSFINTTNADNATVYLNVNLASTLTFPSAVISSDTRWNGGTKELALLVGNYTLVLRNDKTNYRLSVSDIEL